MCQCLPIVAPIGLVMVPTTPLHCVVDGTLEHWDTGTLAHWNTGTLEHWNTGTLGHWDSTWVGRDTLMQGLETTVFIGVYFAV